MRNTIKKAAIFLISIMIILSASLCTSAEEADATTAKAIRFNDDGKLRIMHVTDTHLGLDNLENSVWLIGRACDTEKPDIVVITGDIAMADTIEESHFKIDTLMNVFEERNIPVAITFGNHDSERGIETREQIMAYYNSFDCSISVDDGEELSWCGTYNVPVLGSGNDSVRFNLWIFDSGDYDSEHHYSCVAEDQVRWYVEKSKKLENENGQKI